LPFLRVVNLTAAARAAVRDAGLLVGVRLNHEPTPAILFDKRDRGAFQVCQCAVIHDDLYIMAVEDPVIFMDLVIQRHAVLGATSTSAGNIDPQRMARHIFLRHQILKGDSRF